MAADELRVLVVDDHPINRRLLSELLSHFGCNVSTAESGARALAVCAVDHFDLICLDRHMPGMSGDEVVARLDPDQLVLAWSTDLDDLPDRYNGAIPKPLGMDAVLDAIRRAHAWRRRGPASLAFKKAA